MINPSKEVRAALLSLSKNMSPFDTVTEWFQGNLHKAACDLISARGEEVPRLQRECQVWDMLTNYFSRVDEREIIRLSPQLPKDFNPNTSSSIGRCGEADSDQQ